MRLILDKILPGLPYPVKMFAPSGATYYFDCLNARFISIDLYAGKREKNLNDPALLKWLEQAIESAGKDTHVFIAMHEPLLKSWLPFLGSGNGGALWDLVMKHSDKVKGVFCGHTHSYAHSTLQGKNSRVQFINAGNAGNMQHSDNKLTFVQVSIDGNKVRFRAVQTESGTGKFAVVEEFSAPSAK